MNGLNSTLPSVDEIDDANLCGSSDVQSNQTFTISASPRVARNELIRLLKRCNAGRGLQTSQQHQIYGSTFHSIPFQVHGERL